MIHAPLKENHHCMCLRRHCNLGYSPSFRHPVMWFCIDCAKTENHIKAYHMTQRQLDALEEAALVEGGNAGGQYLDEIDCTDLAKLSEDEWHTFLERTLKGYSAHLREAMKQMYAPF